MDMPNVGVLKKAVHGEPVSADPVEAVREIAAANCTDLANMFAYIRFMLERTGAVKLPGRDCIYTFQLRRHR